MKINFEEICLNCLKTTDLSDCMEAHEYNHECSVTISNRKICANKQEADECPALKKFNEYIENNMIRAKSAEVEFCVRCCRSEHHLISRKWMNKSVNQSNGNLECPLRDEKFDSVEDKLESCKNHTLMIVEGIVPRKKKKKESKDE